MKCLALGLSLSTIVLFAAVECAAQNAPAPPNAAPTYPQAPYGYPYGGNYWGMPPEPPKELAYNGGAIPNGYTLEERYNLGLLIAGPTLFVLGYAVAAFTANEKPGGLDFNGNPSRAPWDALYIPITGPFAFSGYAPGGSAFIYVFEGLAQVVGVGLTLGGILAPKNILVRQFGREAFVPTLHVGAGNVQVKMKF